MTYNTTRRKPLSKVQRPLFLAAHGCRCYWCQQPISDELWDDEHVLARELGGSDDMSNRKPIHRRPCHKEKTALDRKLIAKGNRIRKKNGLDPITRKPRPKMRGQRFRKGGPKQKIQSKPFPKRGAQ